MNALFHFDIPEMGHGLIALAVFAAALPVLISVIILLVLVTRLARARLSRMRPRHAARRNAGVDARLQNLASQRAG